MALAGGVHEMCFATVDALEKLEGIALMLKVDQIAIIAVDPDIGIGPPSSLNLLCCNLIFGLELNFLFSLEVPSPCPLDLDGCNVIHGKSMILEQPSGQAHLVGRLDDGSTEVLEAHVLVFHHDVEGGGQELLAQFLGRCVVCTLVYHRLVDGW